MTNSNIKFVFEETEAIPISIIMEALYQVEDILFNCERDDLDELQKEFPEIPSALVDAAKYRIDLYRGRLLSVQAINKGSVEVVVVIGALCYWVVQNTVGESFKDAWKESDLHKRLKEFFLHRFKRKVESIQYSPFGTYQRLAPGRMIENRFSTRFELSEDGEFITVYIKDDSLIDVPPPYSSLRD